MSRRATRLLPLLLVSAALALLAAGCGGSNAAKSAGPTPTTTAQKAPAVSAQASPQAQAAYQSCLKAHGAGFVGTGTQATAAQLKKLPAALKACASKRPTGANGRQGGFRNNPAFQKYAACLQQHGVTRQPGQGFGGGGGGAPGNAPAGQSAKFKAAAAACASLRPAGGPGGPGAGAPPGN